jgi:hypothetical protein
MKVSSEREKALHAQFKGPEHTICNREYRIKRTSGHLEYWTTELLASINAKGGDAIPK